MARLVVVTHQFDLFTRRRRFWQPLDSCYLLYDVLRELESMGHSWRVAAGTTPVKGDAALLHVDSTIVPEAYLALAAHYPKTLNFGTGDISKRNISSLRVRPGDDWSGPVIVKANHNAKGSMEACHNRRAAKLGLPLPNPGARIVEDYRLMDSIGEIEAGTWADPDLIVERFLPERHDKYYVIRTWVFMGDRERCTWQIADDPIVKAGKVIRYAPAEVPEALRAERERLGFDFGKFDFVMHEGRPILLDTNRTPGVADAIRPMMKAGARNLAEGLDGLLRG